MTLIWIAPAAVTLIGIVLLAAFGRRAAEEAAGLRRDIDRFAELRVTLAEIGTESAALRIRRRR